MTHYRVTCNTKSLMALVESDQPPVACPVDSCENYTVQEEL